MQNICDWESYALTLREEMSSYLRENRFSVIKNPLMTTVLPIRALENPRIIRSKSRVPYVPQTILDKRPKERYYSLLVPSEKDTHPFVTVLYEERKGILRINFVCMSIYECYLYVLGLPNNFPKEQIIVHGVERAKCIPCRSCHYGGKHLYEYELTVPAGTDVDEYRQRIINDLNTYFQLEVSVEKLSVVKDSRSVTTGNGDSLELIWEEQTTMVMRKKRELT